MAHDPCPDDGLPFLHHDPVVSGTASGEGDATPSRRWIAFLHGIYGAGRNWKSVARRIVGERPGWGATMVDLRGHGDSTGFPPPHTVRAAACDLLRTARAAGRTPDAVLGHSFGGKVALEYLRVTEEAHAAGQPEADGGGEAAATVGSGSAPSALWIVDSTPEAREPSGSAWEMLSVLHQYPGPFASRGEGVEALESEGVATPVARWMATNLVEGEEGGWRWRIDVDMMESLLRDFFDLDLWEVVEEPPAGTHVHLVKATESSVLSGEALERIEAAAASSARVHLHRVEGGHWLNADNPDALVELLAREL